MYSLVQHKILNSVVFPLSHLSLLCFQGELFFSIWIAIEEVNNTSSFF